MKLIAEITGPQLSNLQKLSTENLNQANELSIYRGELTTPVVIECIARIKKSFPTLPVGFYEVLSERLKANGFNDERLRDAVANVIDNCLYPTPTIAQFLSWDKRIKVLNYEDIIKKADELGGDENAGKIIRSQYKQVSFPNREKPVWVHVNDVKMYNLKTIS